MISIRPEEPEDNTAVHTINMAAFGLQSQWNGVPDEAFMVIVFEAGILPEGGGVARYRDEFNDAM